LLKWGTKNGFPVVGETLNLAAVSGNINLVRYLINKGCFINKYILTQAIRSGNIDMVNYFRVRRYRFCGDHRDVLKTNVEMVKYIFDNFECFEEMTNREIIEQGSIEVVEYFTKRGTIFDAYDFNTALLCGSVKVAKYIQSKISNITADSIKRDVTPVCANDKIPDLLNYCYELICQGYNYVSFAAELSVKIGDISFVTWLNNDTKTKYGHTLPSKYIPQYKNFIEIFDDGDLLTSAIIYGHTELVKYFNNQVLLGYSRSKYLVEQGCSYSAKGIHPNYNILPQGKVFS
jgi:hypothetical protein